MFSGWPAFYKFFFDRYHWTLAEVNACPIYLACILLGAISPDHTHVRMTFKDTLRYYAEDEKMMETLGRVGGAFRPEGAKQSSPGQRPG